MYTQSPAHPANKPEPTTHTAEPCSPLISRYVDSVVLSLDGQPHGLRRLLLRAAKRMLESQIPAYQQGGRGHE